MCYLCIQGWDWMCCLPLGHAFLCSYWGSKLRPSYSHKHFSHWDITSAPWNFNILISTNKGIPIANLSLMSVPSLQTAHLPSHMSCGGGGGAGVGVGGAADFFRTSNPSWRSAPLTCKACKPEKVLSVTVWMPLLCSRSNSSLLSPWKSFSANLARLLYLQNNLL